MSYHLAPAAVVLAAALSAGASANAGIDVHGQSDWNTITLKYVDADIHTSHGVKSFALGIRVAAREVCGGDDPVIRLGGEFDGCVQAAIDRAIKDLDAPLLVSALGRPAHTLASLDH